MVNIGQADRLDLVTIQQNAEALIERAMAGQSLPDDLTGGTFTITNFGTFGSLTGTPIINQPQVAILAVGVIAKKPATTASATDSSAWAPAWPSRARRACTR